MLIRLLAIGNKMPDWVTQGYREYEKRLPHFCRLELIEIQPIKQVRPDRKELEGIKLLSTIDPDHRVVALEVTGKLWNTEQLAHSLKKWQETGKNIDMLIGGPDGLSSACLEKAEVKWSLSPLTLPHLLVRILVAEQLYRATTILQNHPYHRS